MSGSLTAKSCKHVQPLCPQVEASGKNILGHADAYVAQSDDANSLH